LPHSRLLVRRGCTRRLRPPHLRHRLLNRASGRWDGCRDGALVGSLTEQQGGMAEAAEDSEKFLSQPVERPWAVDHQDSAHSEQRVIGERSRWLG